LRETPRTISFGAMGDDEAHPFVNELKWPDQGQSCTSSQFAARTFDSSAAMPVM
jgi:hypothetical protein